ncbi:hypothetical protein [Pontibacter actiniarum]|nr:hypothetical protein [Pontibacter actiniarum]
MATAKALKQKAPAAGRDSAVAAPHLEQWNEAGAKPSGCMRGNDKPANNGSASAGIYPVHEEPAPEQMSYKDFIGLNYGYKTSR